MPTIERELDDLSATRALAEALAGVLSAGDVVLIDGPMGAGKTTLVRLVAAAMGVDAGSVSSPTFVVLAEHAVPDGPPLVHVDAYRLAGTDARELDLLGWDRLVGPGAGTVALVEWGGRVRHLLDEAACATVRIEPTGIHSRRVRVDVPEAWGSRRGFAALAGVPAATGRDATTCPVTGAPVPADSPTWPFADERARLADLHRWFSGAYTLSRPAERTDVEQGE